MQRALEVVLVIGVCFLLAVAPSRAQSPPQCALQCATAVLAASGCTTIMDLQCICTTPTFAMDAGECIAQECSSSDLNAAAQYFLDLCTSTSSSAPSSPKPSTASSGTVSAPSSTISISSSPSSSRTIGTSASSAASSAASRSIAITTTSSSSAAASSAASNTPASLTSPSAANSAALSPSASSTGTSSAMHLQPYTVHVTWILSGMLLILISIIELFV